MANNRLYIVDEERGDVFFLAKAFGPPWQTRPEKNLEAELDAWLAEDGGRDIASACGETRTRLRLVTEDEPGLVMDHEAGKLVWKEADWLREEKADGTE